jgi:hypothetical protein
MARHGGPQCAHMGHGAGRVCDYLLVVLFAAAGAVYGRTPTAV